jgi:hypothetical protein
MSGVEIPASAVDAALVVLSSRLTYQNKVYDFPPAIRDFHRNYHGDFTSRGEAVDHMFVEAALEAAAPIILAAERERIERALALADEWDRLRSTSNPGQWKEADAELRACSVELRAALTATTREAQTST